MKQALTKVFGDPQARIITLEQDIASTLDNTRPAEPFFFRASWTASQASMF